MALTRTWECTRGCRARHQGSKPSLKMSTTSLLRNSKAPMSQPPSDGRLRLRASRDRQESGMAGKCVQTGDTARRNESGHAEHSPFSLERRGGWRAGICAIRPRARVQPVWAGFIALRVPFSRSGRRCAGSTGEGAGYPVGAGCRPWFGDPSSGTFRTCHLRTV